MFFDIREPICANSQFSDSAQWQSRNEICYFALTSSRLQTQSVNERVAPHPIRER
jgi:hypothetical protein